MRAQPARVRQQPRVCGRGDPDACKLGGRFVGVFTCASALGRWKRPPQARWCEGGSPTAKPTTSVPPTVLFLNELFCLVLTHPGIPSILQVWHRTRVPPLHCGCFCKPWRRSRIDARGCLPRPSTVYTSHGPLIRSSVRTQSVGVCVLRCALRPTDAASDWGATPAPSPSPGGCRCVRVPSRRGAWRRWTW